MGFSFSVVIPTHDRLASLQEVLAAVEAQSGAAELEIVVVDDGSTDGTREWLAAHEFSVPAVVVRQERSGPAAARNAGVAAARGERIAFLGDDTVPAPTWLAEHARAHRERGGSPMLAILGRTRWHHRIRVTPFLDYLNEDGRQFGYGLIRGGEEVPFNFFYTSNLSLARELLVAEPFDVRFPFAVWEDIECSYRLHRRGLRLVYEPAAVVEHDHPTDLESFSARQERAGAAAVVFHRLHPELGPFLGLGPQGPPALPSAAWYRACRALARALDGLPVRGAVLWDAILRYHYIAGLQRGWREASGGEAPRATPRSSVTRRVVAGARRLFAGRVHRLTPLPGADVAFDQGGWRVTGRDPVLRAQTDRPRAPSGWVRISYAWSAGASAEPLALLVESAEGREEAFHLPPAPLGADLVLRLPGRVRGIRIRPPAGLDRLDLGAFEAAELNRWQALRIFLSPYLEPMRRDPRMLAHYLLRSVSSVRRHGPRALWQTIAGRFPSAGEERYAEWVERYDRLDEAERGAARSLVAALRHRPLFSLILPVRGADDAERTQRSIRAQWYEEWELLVVPYGGAVSDAPSRDTGGDPRIRVVASQAASRAAAANDGLASARGEYCAIVDPDGELAPHALTLLALAVGDAAETELLYGDEDELDSQGRRAHPTFKPDWDPDLLLGCDSVRRLAAYRSSLLRSLNGWREGLDGHEDWDLALRASATVDERHVRHVAHVLWHSRRDGEDVSTPAARRVVEDHLRRVGSAARLRDAATLRLDYPVGDPAPLVSFVIPTRNRVDLLRACVESVLQRTDYPALELLIVSNRSDDPSMLAYLEALASDPRIRVLRYDAPFNYSAVNNLAARRAKGSFLVLLNDDIEVTDPGWLAEMIGQASRPGVGAVGAQLFYPDGKVQHAGVVLGLGNVAGHLFRGLPAGSRGWARWTRVPRRVSAVTGACMVVRTELYMALGGLDEEHLPVAFNDIDFCLRLGRRGYRTILTPHARLVHHESATRGLDRSTETVRRLRREEAFMRERWGAELEIDPAYNPNLTLANASAAVAFPPRAKRPWLGRESERPAAPSLAGAAAARARARQT
jgi:GT2 family glycosyltransferase